MYIMPTSTASDATREYAPSDFSHGLQDFCSTGTQGTEPGGVAAWAVFQKKLCDGRIECSHAAQSPLADSQAVLSRSSKSVSANFEILNGFCKTRNPLYSFGRLSLL